MRHILLFAIIVLLASCTKTIYLPVKLNTPSKLINLEESKLVEALSSCQCVSDAVYRDIIYTYRRKDTLRAILDTTKPIQLESN